MQKQTSRWRLVRHAPATGAWNMAVDETLLQQVISDDSIPILRLYAWEPACLSLGQAQPVADVECGRLDARGWGLVRRPTGGRAILHVDELTYAVIAPISEPAVKGTLLESYFKISTALKQSLALLGLEVKAREDPAAAQAARSRNPVCFEEPSSYEILFQGRKIIGSAQARRGNAFLQHGALPLSGDLARITHTLAFADDDARAAAAAALLARGVTLETALNRRVSWDEAAHAFEQGFHQALGIDFVKTDLSQEELEQVEIIQKNKYASDSWTLRV